MLTALLILAAVVLVLALVGVCCQVYGGGFFAVYRLMNNSAGQVAVLLATAVVAILDGFKSN